MACVASLDELRGICIRTSISVTRTSTPRSAKRCMFSWMFGKPYWIARWDWKPTQSTGTFCARSVRTRLYIAVLLALTPSTL